MLSRIGALFFQPLLCRHGMRHGHGSSSMLSVLTVCTALPCAFESLPTSEILHPHSVMPITSIMLLCSDPGREESIRKPGLALGAQL